jgi:hypothetical protein
MCVGGGWGAEWTASVLACLAFRNGVFIRENRKDFQRGLPFIADPTAADRGLARGQPRDEDPELRETAGKGLNTLYPALFWTKSRHGDHG